MGGWSEGKREASLNWRRGQAGAGGGPREGTRGVVDRIVKRREWKVHGGLVPDVRVRGSTAEPGRSPGLRSMALPSRGGCLPAGTAFPRGLPSRGSCPRLDSETNGPLWTALDSAAAWALDPSRPTSRDSPGSQDHGVPYQTHHHPIPLPPIHRLLPPALVHLPTPLRTPDPYARAPPL